MENSQLGRARNAIKHTRNEVQGIRNFERDNVEKGAAIWPVYTLDAARYVQDGYLLREYPWIAGLPDRLKQRRENGEYVLVVDVCGTANAKSIGADHTIGLTLVKHSSVPSNENLTIVEGDVFSAVGYRALLQEIDSRHVPISCVFFKPVGGFVEYEERSVTRPRLYALLAGLYERLAEEGEMYLVMRDYFQELQTLGRVLNSLSENKFCTPAVKKSAIGYSAFYLKKDRDAPKTLPPLKDLPFTEEERANFETVAQLPE